MLNRLSSILLGGGYLATVWYAMDQGFIRRKGIAFEEYAMIAGLLGVGWLVLTVIGGLIARKVGNTERGWGNFNGLTLGTLTILLMLPLHLLYGPRHQTGSPFALDEITYLAIVALFWFVMVDLFRMGLRRLARTDRGFKISASGVAVVSLFIFVGFMARAIIENQGAPLSDGGQTPAEALTMAMAISLLIGFVLMFLLELPRALWLRAKAPEGEGVESELERNTDKENRRVAVPTSVVEAHKDTRNQPGARVAPSPTVVRR